MRLLHLRLLHFDDTCLGLVFLFIIRPLLLDLFLLLSLVGLLYGLRLSLRLLGFGCEAEGGLPESLPGSDLGWLGLGLSLDLLGLDLVGHHLRVVVWALLLLLLGIISSLKLAGLLLLFVV